MNDLFKITLAVVITALLAAACASGGQTSGQTKVPDELTIKLREVSDYLNKKIPAGKKIAFISVQSDSSALTEYVIDELISNAVNDGKFSVVDRQQLDAAREELMFNLSGEVSDQSAQSVGKMLGAQTIITGKLSKIGNSYRFNIRALETETVKLQGSQNWDIAESQRINDLLASKSSGRISGTSTASGSASGRVATAGSTTAKAVTPAKPADTPPVFNQQPSIVLDLWKYESRNKYQDYVKLTNACRSFVGR